MKLVILTLSLFLAAQPLGLGQSIYGQKYRTAVILSGFAFNPALQLGIWDGLREGGKKVDLIIAAGGGALPAALIATSPTKESDLYGQLEDKELQKFLDGTKINRKMGTSLRYLTFYLKNLKGSFNKIVPDVFQSYLHRYPVADGLSNLEVPLSSLDANLLFVSSRYMFSPLDAYQSRGVRKIIKETYFVTTEVREKLIQFDSPIGSQYLSSAIDIDIEFITGVDIKMAVKASMGVPHFAAPEKFLNKSYGSGWINIIPIETATALASEVIAPFFPPLPIKSEKLVLKNVYGYDPEARLKSVHDQYADYWIDLSDYYELFSKTENRTRMHLKRLLSMDGSVFSHCSENDRCRLLHNEIYAYGRTRALEALRRAGKNNKGHIRNLTESNSSNQLRSGRTQ